MFSLNEWLILSSFLVSVYHMNKFYLAFQEKLNKKILQKLLVIEILFILILL